MARSKNRSGKEPQKKGRDIKRDAIQLARKAGFDKKTTESLIKEMEEICAFEDSLEEF